MKHISTILPDAFPLLGLHLIVLALCGEVVDKTLVAGQPDRVRNALHAILQLAVCERTEILRQVCQIRRGRPSNGGPR